jgi:hypothetical protein
VLNLDHELRGALGVSAWAVKWKPLTFVISVVQFVRVYKLKKINTSGKLYH